MCQPKGIVGYGDELLSSVLCLLDGSRQHISDEDMSLLREQTRQVLEKHC